MTLIAKSRLERCKTWLSSTNVEDGNRRVGMLLCQTHGLRKTLPLFSLYARLSALLH